MKKLILPIVFLMLIGAGICAEEPRANPSPAYIAKPVISQGALTHRQVTSIMDALGFRLEGTAARMLGPDTYTQETWVKTLADGSTLKLHNLCSGPSYSSQSPRFSFQRIPRGSTRPASTQPSGEEPVMDQYELTPAQVASLMSALGLEHERTERHRDEPGSSANYDLEVWKKPLPDGGALRLIIRISHGMGPFRPVSFEYQGIPVR